MSAIDIDDIPTSRSANPHFNDVAARARARRGFMKSGLGLGAIGFFGGAVVGCGSDDGATAVSASPSDSDGTAGTNPPETKTRSLLGFQAVAANSLDTITVPEGYRSAVFCRWGDPLFPNSPAWRGDASDDAQAQLLQFGDNHDGMHFFPLRSGDSSEGLLVMNHEYFNAEYFFTPDIQAEGGPWTADSVLKGQHAHGVSVAHVQLQDGNWRVVLDSPFNRRIHLNTPMLITGPAKGHPSMCTGADPGGEASLGTVNNCGNGYTLWNTYLTCEENFNGYFGTRQAEDGRTASMKRYGIPASTSGYRWEEHDERFDYAIEPNECNRMGWIVEIDPFDPLAPPRKRTALGRFKHENAAQTLAKDNRVVVYMGDDQANDYIYKFVSAGRYDKDLPGLNRNLLDAGTLHVAKFGAGAAAGDMMGTGEWVPLVLATPTTDGGTLGSLFADMGALLIDARLAADAVGATRMDRPEWITVHPSSGEVYCTLTNNSSRKAEETDDANPRAANVYGQIVRWREADGDAAALAFDWDLFVLAGNPGAQPEDPAAPQPDDPAAPQPVDPLMAGSANVTAQNTFNSPDGLAFDADGRLWIQTDGNFSNAGPYAGQGNNQMLVADPESREIRRFLVGPSGCEITGITWTPDQKYVFVNVQHPGEYGSHPDKPEVAPAVDPLAFSKWPEASGGRPRSATVVVWREDGGKVGA